MKKLFGAAIAGALMLSGAGSAGAGLQPQFDPTLTLSPTTGFAGTTFTVSGTTCTGQDGGVMRVEVTAPDTDEVTATATPNDAGDWSTTLTAPADAEDGDSIVVNAECIEDFNKQLEESGFQGFRAPAGDNTCLLYTSPSPRD